MKELFTVYKKSLFIGCMLQLFQQTSGINTIMYYGPTIILSSGIQIGGLDPKAPTTGIILNLPLAFMNALGSFITSKIIDRLGRRYIMLRFIPGTVISLLIVSFGMYLSTYEPDNTTPQRVGGYLSLIGLFLFICFFTIALSGVVWAINAEIYPIHLVGTGNSLATSSNWLSNFIVSSFFSYDYEHRCR